MNENPLANETLINKITSRFGKGKKEEPLKLGVIRTELVGMNNAIDICAEACACCWDKAVPNDYAGRAEYVGKRSKTGHTSILEHSNHDIYMNIPYAYNDDLVSFLDMNKYLNHRIYKNRNGDWCLLIGGSYRGYCDLYLNTDDINNPILKAITGNLYIYANSAAFEDICKLGLMDKSKFMNAEPDENCMLLSDAYSRIDNKLFSIVAIDGIKKLYTNLYRIDEEFAKSLTTFDLIDFVTITVLFKDMSRASTHQLVRHRNAITQESQRYVDYSKAGFTSPAEFKPGKYDPDHKYRIQFGPSGPMHMTLQEIGDAICNLYDMLNNPAIAGKEHALLREDARGYLPANVQCRKLYMTFTYKKFFKFLELREASGAQAEIRTYASAIGNCINSITEFDSRDLMYLYNKPRLMIEDPFKIDVDEGVEETVVQMTEDDYIRAAGLDKEEN
jgi:flavin-dependent thymidylate synthase